MLDSPFSKNLSRFKYIRFHANEHGDIYVSEFREMADQLKIRSRDLVYTYFSRSKGCFVAAACDPVPSEATIPVDDFETEKELFIKLIKKSDFLTMLEHQKEEFLKIEEAVNEAYLSMDSDIDAH